MFKVYLSIWQTNMSNMKKKSTTGVIGLMGMCFEQYLFAFDVGDIFISRKD